MLCYRKKNKLKVSKFLKYKISEYILHAMVPKENDGTPRNLFAPVQDELDHSIKVGFTCGNMPRIQVLFALKYAEVFLAWGYVIAVGPLHHQRNFQLPEDIKRAVRGVVSGAVHCPDGILSPAGALLIQLQAE